MLGRREDAVLHFVLEALGRVADQHAEVEVLLDELRREVGVHAEEVIHHQDLAVASRAGADADHGDPDAARDLGREIGRHHLQDQRVAAGFLERLGVGD